MQDAEQVPTETEPTTISVARVYDYLLGGTNHFTIDRAGAEQIKKVFPEISDWAWCNRGFHQRAARWLAVDVGIRQFIDIGSGLPTQVNTHEVVQLAIADGEGGGAAPDEPARVVYVDNDSDVVAQAKSLLSGVESTAFILGDLRRPEEVFHNAEVRSLIDFDRPVALLSTAVVHFISDELDPWGSVGYCMDRLASGSYLVLSHGTYEKQNPETVARVRAVYDNANEQVHPRSKPDVERFFAGLELVPPYAGARPAVTFGGLWGAEDPELADDDASRALYAGVARKP